MSADSTTLRVAITIPMRLESVANKRENWSKRRRREHEQAITISAHILRAVALGHVRLSNPPHTVTFVRWGKRDLDDDNLAIAFKSARDHVARMFNVDDDPRGPITWKYTQCIGDWAIQIVLESEIGSNNPSTEENPKCRNQQQP